MIEPIFQSELFMNFILPFVLVFTLVFAILQRTKLLGESVKQINALIGLVVGLILIAFPFSRDIIIILMPFLAVSVAILFVFMLLYGFVWAKSGDVLHKGVKVALGIIIGIGVVSIVIYAAGLWDNVYDFLFNRADASQIWVNVILVIIIIGAMLTVVLSKEKGESSKEK